MGPSGRSCRDFCGEAIADRSVGVYKNNVDGKGASYGCHENFLVDRKVSFEDLARRITAHLVTRSIFTGAGRVGLGQSGQIPGFQISQRADYIEAEVGLETTLRRPIVNTRDEPHAHPDRWRRLHVIIGDANCLDIPTYLKIGTTSLILRAIEADDVRLDDWVLDDPVSAVSAVSRDLSLNARLPIRKGAEASALDIQRGLLAICRDYAEDDHDREVIRRWESLLIKLGEDFRSCGREIEWVAKLAVLERFRQRNSAGASSLGWDDPRLAAIDLQWSDLDPSRGLAERLRQADEFENLVTTADVSAAVHSPPRNTRAWVRGQLIASRGEAVDAAGWTTVVIDDGGEDLRVVEILDPHESTHPILDEATAP